MTKLFDDPRTFSEDLLAGFCDLYGDRVLGGRGRRRAGRRDARARSPSWSAAAPGTIRRSAASSDPVSPTAPSSATSSPRRPPRRRTRSGGPPSNGAGLLFSTGNYAGDVMNFTLAQQRLRDEGIDTRVVFVTDDIASAPVEEINKRRGIAGDFVVFKVAGAAAEAGYDLDGGRTGRPAGQRPHPDPGRRLRRLHHARRGRAAVHRPGRPDGRRPGHPRRARHRRGRPAPGRRPRAPLVDGVLAEAPGDSHPGRGDPQRARRHQVRGAVRRVAHRRPAAARGRLHDSSTPRSASWSPASTWPAAR